jgi:hypothetical protein
MKGATGILLVGGGVFLLIALFSGQLKFPLGQVNVLGSTLGNVFNLNQQTITGQTGVTSSGAGYYTSTSTGTPVDQQATCKKGGGVWFNGECRHFTGAGVNK